MKQVVGLLLICVSILSFSPLAAQNESSEKEKLVMIDTSMGKIKIKLFNDTPLHRDNFLKNVEEKRYDGTIFHRIIRQFMVQAGDFNSINALPDSILGEDNLDYTIPAEFVYPKYFHKRGALCAARTSDDKNPSKASSPAQFYIVTGKHFTDMELDKMERNNEMTFTPEQRTAYKLEGGTPHLDGTYTVFGEVVSGIKVVDKIQFVPIGDNDRPLKNVVIKSIKVVEK